MSKTPEGFHRHKNGGGLVQDTARVAEYMMYIRLIAMVDAERFPK